MIDFESAPTSGKPQHLRLVTREGDYPPYIRALNDKQRQAALATDGPLIVLAGAGSGKTKMLTTRIAWLIDGKGVAPHQILAVTFTNKAAAEMRERVGKSLGMPGPVGNGYGLGNPEIGTFHAVCTRILRREQAFTPFTKPFVIYDDSDQLSLIKGVLNKLQIDDKAFSAKGMQGGINRLKCEAVEPQEMDPPPHDIWERKLKQVYEQYQRDLFANNAVDFGEIITMAYRLLRDNAEVRRKYQNRWRYLHVDEYQDTNRAQYLLLSQLAKPEFGGHANICVVGDEDQSIYKWRGADIKNILDFEQDYPGATVVKLEQNYRSTKTIIAAAGHVIRNNKERKDKTLWTDNEEGIPIVRAQLPDERGEAEFVVGEIKKIARDRERGYGDFAIFYRTHAQSRQFEDVLRREKIPYQIVGGLRFYDRKEIKDVLCYFRAMLNPSDSISLKRIINVPARGIGKTTIEKIELMQDSMAVAGDADSTFWAALQKTAREPGAAAKKVSGFVHFMERLMVEQPKLLLSEMYHLILDETGYVRELRQENTEESLARIENLEEFDTLLQEFEEDFFEQVPETEREGKRIELLATFIEQSTLVSEADTQDLGQQAVKMMSLHSSKGLEFPVVFLSGMEEGLFPSVKAWEETPDEDIEEERRLCYVGITRARENLFLTHVVVRRIWGNISYQEPARFFGEIPTDLIELKDLSHGNAANAFRAGSSRNFSFRQPGAGPAFSGGDDFDQRSSVDEFSQLPEDGGVVGRKLDHPEYGRGTILALDGSGNDQKVTIEFKGKNQRKFLLRYVKSYLDPSS